MPHLMTIEQFQNPGEPGFGAEVGGGQGGGRLLPAGKQVRLDVHVEAQAHGDAGIARPRARRQLAADARRGDCLT